MALKVRLQGLSPAAQVESELANARLTKPLTICAGAMAQSVEFTSLTGLPEIQRLSETLREDARWPWASCTRAHRETKRCDLVFSVGVLEKIVCVCVDATLPQVRSMVPFGG